MTSARAEILSNIRRSLGVTGAESIRRAMVEDRLERAPKGVIPARGQLDAPGRAALFQAQAEAALATVCCVAAAADIPQETARYLRDNNLPATIRIGSDPRLANLPWDKTTLGVSHGPSSGGDLNAVSHAFGAVAETGTLALTSGAENPTTLNFLPDNHIVALFAKDIAGDFEGIWQKLRMAHGKGTMPRTLNFITGPSRSGDIEQTMLLGAHGPRRLHIVLVEG
jgi:L-lactate dehydrogenase complex protein LldG